MLTLPAALALSLVLPHSSPMPALMRSRVATMQADTKIADVVLKTDEALVDQIGSVLVPLRVATGILMIHHGSEGGFFPANYGTPGFEGFIDFIIKPYFGFLPGDPAFWSAIHDYIEWFGGFFLAAGFLTRPTAVALFGTMVAAVYFHLASTGLQGFPFGHVESYSYNFEEPALYAFIFLLFAKTGAGPLSIDEKLSGGD